MPTNRIPFAKYGVLQIVFVIIIFANFLLTLTFFISKNDDERNGVVKFFLPLIISNSTMLATSCAVFYILVFSARVNDIVGNIVIRKRTASFKVALFSWILTNIETILRLYGLFHYRSKALDHFYAPWWLIAGYHILLLFQRTFQLGCLHVYEKNTLLRREGPGWMITRRSFLVIMAFMNCYMWILNVSKIKVLVDLTSHHMEHLLSTSVARIIYTINQASTLAYHVESAQLFYKFYNEDEESVAQQPYEALEANDIRGVQAISESQKGNWIGFFTFMIYVAMATGSFLVRNKTTSIHWGATAAIIFILIVIFCITLNTTLSHGNQNNNDNEAGPGEERNFNMFKDITSYIAGEDLGHIKILLFYSICAVSYHSLLCIKIILDGVKEDLFHPFREGCKCLICISLTVFMFWMSHHRRKLRCWCDLNLMFWNVLALVCLELIEETFEHSTAITHDENLLQSYVLPLAIDFKIYVLIHTLSDTKAATNDYREELRREALQPTASQHSSRSTTPLSNESSLDSSMRYS